MMNYPQLASRLYNTPLLITPGKAEIIEHVFRSHQEGRPALLAPPAPAATEVQPRAELLAPGTVRMDAGYYRTSSGVAIIPVLGTLVQRAGGMDALSGMTGYNRIGAIMQAALADPQVGAVLFEIDSPGGEANGAFDLAAKIRAATTKKPIWAVANEQAFSAGYLLASAAERVSAPESAMVGSVGVVALHVDQSGKDAKQGLVYTPIYAGAHKVDFSSHAPLSAEALKMAQEEVNHMYDLFVSAVSTGRGLSEQAVRDTEAGIFSAKVAQRLTLVDSVEPFDATVEALAKEAQQVRSTGMRVAASTPATPIVDEEQTMATGTVETFSAEQLAAAESNGNKSGAQAERQRIAAILNSEAAKGKSTLATHLALETELTPEQALGLLAKAEAQQPDQFAAAMAKLGNPNIGADASGSGDQPARKLQPVDDIYATRQQASSPVK
jgi:signal peptide peptidase SppA